MANPTHPPAVLLASPSEGRRTFLLVQVLRAVAALMVVWLHTTMMQNEHLDPSWHPWLAGAAGVDLFFVISGFVMAISSARLGADPHPARTFLLRRIERVVPLYWLATSVKIILALLFPLAAAGVTTGTWHIVASYLFLPSANSTGALHPVLIVGWTLNYEMFFYLLFALGLALRLRLLPYLSWLLILLGAAGFLRTLQTPALFSLADPLLWEFLYGILLARVLPHLNATKPWQKALCIAAIVAAFTVIVIHPGENILPSRAILWGLPALVIVASSLALENTLGRWMPRWLLELGDASYSIYLTHTILLAGLAALVTRFRIFERGGLALEALICWILCLLASEVVYRTVELPILRFFQGRRRRAIPAVG